MNGVHSNPLGAVWFRLRRRPARDKGPPGVAWWLFKLKENQTSQYMELARLYRLRDKEDGQEDDKNTDGMGGRIETRRVFLFPEMKGWFGWPHLAQGVAVEKHTIQKRTGKETREVMFALTSLPSGTKAKTILDIFRNHWSVENKVHHVLEWNPLTILHRKVGRGSRATRPTRRLPALPGCGAAILGGIRRVALSLLQRIKGKRTIPDIMRHLHANGRILRLCLGKS